MPERVAKRGIGSWGLAGQLRERFQDGAEHTLDAAAAAVAELIPPEIAGREYQRHYRGRSWPPPADRYASEMFMAKRTIVYRALGTMPGIIWTHEKGEPRRFKLTLQWPVRESKATAAERRDMIRAYLRAFPHKSDSAIARQCGVSQPTVGNIRRQLIKSSMLTPGPTEGLDGKIRQFTPGTMGRKRRGAATTTEGSNEIMVTVPLTVDGVLDLITRLSGQERALIMARLSASPKITPP